MDLLDIATLLIVLTAAFGYINVRFLKLPVTIGLMVVSMVFSLIMIGAGFLNPDILQYEKDLVSSIDFHALLMEGMLSLLLFAGALHVDFGKLKRYSGPILAFATLGVLTSATLIGTASWGLLHLLGIPIDFIYCLLFGALISPTDPIAALGILKRLGVPKKLEIKIVGESLINDGIGVVLFLTLYQIASVGVDQIEATDIGLLVVEEIGGGVLLGLVLGWIAFQLMRTIDNYEVEVMITLAVVMGGYLLASKLHFSGPLAMVVAGLMVGNEGFRSSTMSDTTRQYVDKFWEIIDVILNALLFVLIGLEVVILPFEWVYMAAGLLAIPIVLASRFAGLLLPVRFFRRRLEFEPYTTTIMTWGGLRGGISIALALSLAPEMQRDLLLGITYLVVAFSIIGQGLTIDPMLRRLGNRDKPTA